METQTLSVELVSIGIIEKDTNNDILWTWTYPSISSNYRSFLKSKSGLDNGLSLTHEYHSLPFFYCHHQSFWFYLRVTDALEFLCLPKVKHFVIVLQTNDFNPEKYEALSEMLSKVYSSSGNPANLLQLYLSVLLKGTCSVDDIGIFLAKNYDKVTAYSCVSAKDIVKTFGLETILIYTALLLKKRVVVYHHRLHTLLWFVRALPAFIWHRQDWNIIYPYMQLTNLEISELLSLSTYVAGFTDSAVEGKTELYDLFVNLPAIEITIAGHAKEIFTMTKTHKEIAIFMTNQAENNQINDKLFVKEVAKKTAELLKNLRSLSSLNDHGQEIINLSVLQEKKCSPALQHFLHHLAVAEGFMAF